MYQNNYNLNFVPGGVPLTIHISQYDVGTRTFHFTPIAVPGTVTTFTGASATLEATKPDGYAVIQNCVYNSDGTIDYTVQEQLAAKAGKVWSKIVLRDGENVIGTAAVVWIVDKAGVTDDAVISDSDIRGMQAYVDQLKTLVGTPVAVSTAAGMTDTGKIYLYTGSEAGYTSGNWYYYNGTAWVSGGVYGGSDVEVDPTLSIAGEAADAKATGDAVNDLKSALASALPAASASGAVASFTDGADNVPVEDLKISIEPKQSGSGDPSPSNVRAISGWDVVKVTRTGKNLLPKYVINPTYNNVAFTVNADGSVHAVGTASPTCNAGNTITGLDGEFILTGCPEGGGASTYQIWIFDVTANAATQITDTGSGSRGTLIGSHTYNIRIRIQSGYTIDQIFYPMLRPASIADSTYEPYTASEYTVSLASAGTVYGGTLDVTTGVLTLDRTMIAVKNMAWVRTTSYAHPVFYVNQKGKASTYQKGACSFLRDISRATTFSAQGFAGYAENGDFAMCSNNAQIFVRYDDITDVSTFKTQFADETFVYPITNPTTYTLTPTEVRTLLGNNNIWADTGDSTVEYKAETGRYIENRISAQQKLISGVETSYTATKNYAIGNYVIVNDTLYKVTAAIATGATIAPGTNCVATTVAEQLILLANA